MTSEIEKLYTRTRNHPICQHLVPLESVLSYPVPVVKGEHIYLRFFLYQRGRAQPGQSRPVFRPYANLSIEYPSGKIVEYTDLLFSEGVPESPTAEQVDETPHPMLVNLDFQEVVERRSAFFNVIEKLIQSIGQDELTSNEEASITLYRELFAILIEPGLYFYYRGINPFFFDWLERFA